ncbi:hypothetical protein C8F01DRAFT_1081684 [Mycena amicta]|nr:hypothetical protein C8F01DRAFT_1081684 [Mycena amicta]
MVMSIGYNPVYKNTERSAEVHVLHEFEADFYGVEMRLLITGFIRRRKTTPRWRRSSRTSTSTAIPRGLGIAGDGQGHTGWELLDAGGNFYPATIGGGWRRVHEIHSRLKACILSSQSSSPCIWGFDDHALAGVLELLSPRVLVLDGNSRSFKASLGFIRTRLQATLNCHGDQVYCKYLSPNTTISSVLGPQRPTVVVGSYDSTEDCNCWMTRDGWTDDRRASEGRSMIHWLSQGAIRRNPQRTAPHAVPAGPQLMLQPVGGYVHNPATDQLLEKRRHIPFLPLKMETRVRADAGTVGNFKRAADRDATQS